MSEPEQVEVGTLPKYRCHKVVRAAKITQITVTSECERMGKAWLVFGDICGPGMKPLFAGELVTQEWMAKHKPEVGGYFVVYPGSDNYSSYSPAKAFEEGYAILTASDAPSRVVVSGGAAAMTAIVAASDMKDQLEMAWAVIANVHGGDWDKAPPEWRDAAAKWRDRYHASIGVSPFPDKPQTGRYTVDFKNPDFLHQVNAVQVTDEAREKFAEFGEYFQLEIDMDADMTVHGARFLPVQKGG